MKKKCYFQDLTNLQIKLKTLESKNKELRNILRKNGEITNGCLPKFYFYINYFTFPNNKFGESAFPVNADVDVSIILKFFFMI